MGFTFKPHPGAQTRFMSYGGRYALFGGAKGGGKSQCLLYDPFRQIKIEQERVNRGEITVSTGRAIYFRRTMPELREVITRSKRTFKLIDPGAEWNEAAKTWTFSCGYQYVFGQMEEDDDWLKYYGIEFTEVIFDELTLFTETQFDELDLCLRSADPVLQKMLYMRAGTNPVGPGLAWVKERFYDVAPPGTPVVRKVKTKIYKAGVITGEEWVESEQIFIPARVEDNPSINQAEYSALLSSKTPAMRRALLEGDWTVSESAFLADIWDPAVHVCEPFKIPAGWPKFRSGDYGFSWPGLSSIQWWAVDTDGNLTCYRSYTTHGENAEMLAYRIREIETEAGEWDVARGCSKLRGPLDSSCWNQTGAIGPTIAESFFMVGVLWDKCDKNREAAAEQMRQRLMRRTGHPTLKDKNGKPLFIVPGIRWFKTCYSYVRQKNGKRAKVGPVVTLPILPADELNPDVPDTKGNDHDYDAASYACMSRPMSAMDERTPPDELAEYKKRERQSQQPKPGRMGYGGMW